MEHRLEQLNGAYKKAIGAILLKLFPQLTELTVSDVLVDPSGKTGRVWLATTTENFADVTKMRHEIQLQLTKYVKTRYTPKFSYLIDDNYLGRIDELFTNIKNEN